MKISNRVNLSSTFPVRTKCKYCLSGPTYYSSDSIFFRRLNIQDARQYQKVVKRMMKINRNWYSELSFSHFLDKSGISILFHKPTYMGHHPTLYRKRGVSDRDIEEYFVCTCFKTKWKFHFKATQSCPEIAHRRARYSYPTKS